MPINFHIKTSKPEIIEEKLKLLDSNMKDIAVNMGEIEWRRRNDEFWIKLDYATSNVLFNLAVKRKLCMRIRLADPNASIETIKT